MRLVFALPGNETFAARLALEAGAELGQLETRQFPDGEHYVRLLSDPAGRDVDIVCTLVRADSVILTLLFVAAAARTQGRGGSPWSRPTSATCARTRSSSTARP